MGPRISGAIRQKSSCSESSLTYIRASSSKFDITFRRNALLNYISQGIAPLLIIFRVIQGRAWNESTATKLATANFSEMRAATSELSSATEEPLSVISVSKGSTAAVNVRMEGSKDSIA
jgi:hypothetical protein